jgi:drug/metabolite transporter (DMT)-like permease
LATSIIPKRFLNPYLVLAIGLLATSTAAIFIRLAQEENLNSMVIAAGRMIVASLILTPGVLGRYRAELRQLDGRDWLLCLFGGAILAVHFAAWISSLEYTSVVASVVLVTTNPLFVALLSYPLLGEKVNRMVIGGILLAFVGGVIVALSGDAGDPPTRPDALLGNGLAVIGAIAAASYFIIGRRVRARLSVIPYIWLVYSAAAFFLALVVLGTGESFTGYSTAGYVWLIALGLVPQLIGHSAFNYALGYLPAAYVSLIVLGEPIGSGILAFFLLGEIPAALALLGLAIILTGIAIASRQSPQTE